MDDRRRSIVVGRGYSAGSVSHNPVSLLLPHAKPLERRRRSRAHDPAGPWDAARPCPRGGPRLQGICAGCAPDHDSKQSPAPSAPSRATWAGRAARRREAPGTDRGWAPDSGSLPRWAAGCRLSTATPKSATRPTPAEGERDDTAGVGIQRRSVFTVSSAAAAQSAIAAEPTKAAVADTRE